MAFQLFEQIADNLQPVCKLVGLPTEEISASLSFCDIAFGDVSSNIVMRNAAKLSREPMELALELASKLEPDDIIASAEAVEPGFVNIRLTSRYLLSQIEGVKQSGVEKWFLSNLDLAPRKIVMDYSHPNMGKPMGVHHLLSTVVGDAIKRMYRYAGVKVIADNFIGDLGTQFGKLIWAVKQWGDLEKIEKDPVAELLKLYIKFHIEADQDVELDDAGRVEYQKLESGDPESRALWQKICGWSMADVSNIYQQLGVSFDEIHGESFYEDKMETIIDQGIKQGYFVKSDGALVAFMNDPNLPPAIIKKKDGTTLYLTRDLARIKFWEQTWHPDKMLVVVDSAQKLHFQQVFEVATKLNLTMAENIHVSFGRMRFRDASMSTRKGNILQLTDLLTEARRRVARSSAERDVEARGEYVEKIAVGAIKYGILHQNRNSDLVFSWESVLSLEGNSALYIMYAFARTQSVKSKAPKSTQTGISKHQLSDSERELIQEVLRIPQLLQKALIAYEPHVLCDSCFQLAQKYNKFYNTNTILNNSQQSYYRLVLNNIVGEILQQSMAMLGIDMPARI
jgi:arginyl-tRNA synthetase